MHELAEQAGIELPSVVGRVRNDVTKKKVEEMVKVGTTGKS